MDTIGLIPATGATADGSSLALLRLPFSFSQERLLRTKDFISLAEEWDSPLTREELFKWHQSGVFYPVFTAVDEIDQAFVIDVAAEERGDPADFAREGRLRDSASMPASSVTYDRPKGADHRWWDGFLFSRWQVLEIKHARARANFLEFGEDAEKLRLQAVEDRRMVLALSALEVRHLPLILGLIRYNGGVDSRLQRSRFDIDDATRLALAAYPAEQLRRAAEILLSSARFHDPMADWWPLIRHSSNNGWSSIRGSVRYAIEQRIAAEMFLRAHESIAELGLLSPLPGPNADAHVREPLYDRISAAPEVSDSLERALGQFGLSPFPRVLLALEGRTEVIHVSALLAELGLDRPSRVRIQNMGTSNLSPHLLARYATSPRIGPARYGRQLLDATPTALFVAMDPENLWEDQTKRDEQRAALHTAIRSEVAAQGAEITDQELEMLVHIFVWGNQKYELANFTDDELATALTELAKEQSRLPANAEAWRAKLGEDLAYARAGGFDIKVVFGRSGMLEAKPRLAELLLPILMEKFEKEVAADGGIVTPVVDMVMQVYDLCQRLAGGTYSLATPPASTETSD